MSAAPLTDQPVDVDCQTEEYNLEFANAAFGAGSSTTKKFNDSLVNCKSKHKIALPTPEKTTFKAVSNLNDLDSKELFSELSKNAWLCKSLPVEKDVLRCESGGIYLSAYSVDNKVSEIHIGTWGAADYDKNLAHNTKEAMTQIYSVANALFNADLSIFKKVNDSVVQDFVNKNYDDLGNRNSGVDTRGKVLRPIGTFEQGVCQEGFSLVGEQCLNNEFINQPREEIMRYIESTCIDSAIRWGSSSADATNGAIKDCIDQGVESEPRLKGGLLVWVDNPAYISPKKSLRAVYNLGNHGNLDYQFSILFTGEKYNPYLKYDFQVKPSIPGATSPSDTLEEVILPLTNKLLTANNTPGNEAYYCTSQKLPLAEEKECIAKSRVYNMDETKTK